MLVLTIALGTSLLAQEQRPANAQVTAAAQVKEEKPSTATAQEQVAEPGTGESITYIGRKLWFEMRKRLNLTTEEEENKQRVEEQSYKLRIGGIKVRKEE